MKSTHGDAWAACVVALLSAGACASTGTFNEPLQPGPEDVLSELARRSMLPEAQLGVMLGDCEASPQNRYLCTFRDFVAEDLALKRLVADKLRTLPQCTVLIESKVAHLEHTRDESCRQTAQLTQGDSSSELTAQTACAAGATVDLLPQIRRISHCASRTDRTP